MKNFSGIHQISIVATAAALGCLLVTGVASPHDMAAMDGMGGSADGHSMSHTMAAGAMGSHMSHMENHMRMTELRPSTPQDEAHARASRGKLRTPEVRRRDDRA